MKKSILFLALVMGAIIGKSQPQHSFFVIHCDPGYADDTHWNTLMKMADSASFYNVPLTMEFSPQWVNMILSDPNKIMRVRTWQQNGHEIAGHHHGIYHCMWDSLTNYPVDSIQANQPVYTYVNGSWVSNCDSGIFKSPMQPFFDSLDVLAGDSLLLTWGASDDYPEVDLYPGLLYRTTGGRDTATQGFSNPYTETYGPTTLSTGVFGPYTVCLIDYFFLYDQSDVNAMQMLYNNVNFSGQYKVVGVVTHVFNVKNQNQNLPGNFFYQWLRFISGKGCKNVRDIMRAEGCVPNNIRELNAENVAVTVYPVPASEYIMIQANDSKFFDRVEVLDISGKTVKTINVHEQSCRMGIRFLPAGFYFLKVHFSSGEVHTVRMIKK